MNLIVNLISIKSGGGQQVASNFITQLIKRKDVIPFFLVTRNTFIHRKLIELEYSYVFVVNESLISRLKFYLFDLSRIVNENDIDLIYTMFGPGLHYKKIKSITGCAYSNIFYPEIEFWNGYSFFQLIKLKLIDLYRLKSTLKSTYIVFENESMQRRATALFNYPEERTKLILPSISDYSNLILMDDFRNRLNVINEDCFNILMLTGWHKNKNINMVPEILLELERKGFGDTNFIITVPECDKNSILLMESARKLGVEDKIILFGSVVPHNVKFLYERISAVMLLSLLESFSNNIIESWFFKKPLFIANEEWSKSICKDAAIFVDRNNSCNISGSIINYRKNSELRDITARSGEDILRNFPSPEEKVNLQIEFLKDIFNRY